MKPTELQTRSITGALIGLVVFTLILIFPPIITTVALVACLAWILAYEWPSIAAPWGKRKWLLTLFYPILPFWTIIKLNQIDPHVLALLFVLVFTCDTACYFVGTRWGTHPIAPTISPKKSWQGCIGGMVATVSALLFANYWLGGILPLWACVVLGTATGILAIGGDFFESWLKRKARLKDAGRVLPGHGGLLDRFDSMLFVAPFYYYFLRSFL